MNQEISINAREESLLLLKKTRDNSVNHELVPVLSGFVFAVHVAMSKLVDCTSQRRTAIFDRQPLSGFGI